MNPYHYPVEARCLECGQPVRCERFVSLGRGDDWRHIGRFTLAADVAATG